MTSVLLATCARLPDGEPGGTAVLTALADRGVRARWAVWDDPSVDWAAADLVAIRSTWDYHRSLDRFLGWTRSVEAVTRLTNDADTVAWNVDKAYLIALATRVPTVPTVLVDDLADDRTGLSAALGRWGTTVIKPRVGASGVGVVVATGPQALGDPGLSAGPWISQPLVESVSTDGETSVFVCSGRAVTQIDKRPAAGEIRVHVQYGGRAARVPLDPERAAMAEAAVAAAGPAGGLAHAPAYARVDLMRWQDQWAVSELELIEPGLYLQVEPATAAPYVAAVAALL